MQLVKGTQCCNCKISDNILWWRHEIWQYGASSQRSWPEQYEHTRLDTNLLWEIPHVWIACPIQVYRVIVSWLYQVIFYTGLQSYSVLIIPGNIRIQRWNKQSTLWLEGFACFHGNKSKLLVQIILSNYRCYFHCINGKWKALRTSFEFRNSFQ